MSKKINKTPRRILTASMSLALLISLSSCSGVASNDGIKPEDIYAQAGKYQVTNGDIWNELQWNSISVLNDKITNAVLDEQIQKINTAMGKADDDEEKKQYSERLVDYVVQDIYDQTFSKDDYWKSIKDIEDEKDMAAIEKYVDEMYTANHKYLGNGTREEFVKELLKAKKLLGEYFSLKEDKADKKLIEEKLDSVEAIYLKVANEFKDKYYPLLAKELLAFTNLNEDVKEAWDKDEDDEDDKAGYFTHAQYKTMFENKYTNTYNLNMVMIRFTSDEEYQNTLRAFGLKFNNKQLYYIADKEDNMSYNEYIDYYDDYKFDSSEKENAIDSDEAILQIYIQMYNYIYGGYRQALPSAYGELNDINDLRKRTKEILDDDSNYTDNEREQNYNDTIKELNKCSDTLFTSDQLNEISSTFKNYAYETLIVDSKNSEKLRYSTSTQSANAGYYIAYKFGDEFDKLEGDIKKYEQWFLDDPDITSFDFYDDYIMKEDGLREHLEKLLMHDELTESMISTAVDDEKKEVSVKIYNEALEISYLKNNPNYSKTLGSPKKKDTIATITYNKKNIDLSLKDVYNTLEAKNGATVAIDLLADQIIKDSQAYADAKNDKESIHYYEEYLDLLLVNFANGGLAQQGYGAEMGKYNFLMLYFHTADVKEIVNNYYLVQHAASQLLTKYNNDNVAQFFKDFTDKAYNEYFSLSGTRLVVYMDKNDDNLPDEGEESWNAETTAAAKNLILTVYNKLAASSTPHKDRLTELVNEINNSARVQFSEDPTAPENIWAEYRHLGLKVKTEDFATTNADVEIDFALKSRLNDYARGQNEDGTKKYEYFINDQAPSAYMEPLDSTKLDEIVKTNDGYNLILVTTGTQKPSAKYEKDDDLLDSIKIKYNEKYVTINGIDNDEDTLNLNQIKLFLVDNAVNGASTLSPSSIQSALTTFLQPVLQRFSSAESQRIQLLHYIGSVTDENFAKKLEEENKKDNPDYEGLLSNTIKFTNNDTNGYLKEIIIISEHAVDSYNHVYGKNNPNIFDGWWKELGAKAPTFWE